MVNASTTRIRFVRVALVALAAACLTVGSLSGQGGGARGGGGGGRGGRGGMALPPARDATDQMAIGSAVITGTVVTEGAGTPVRRARVSLSAPELRGGRSVHTDDQGRFAFQALPAGRYTVTASKAGFVSIAFGARQPGRQGTPVQLEDGQHLERLTISMPRGGVLTGVVLDEYGEPAAGTQVRALRFIMRTGERTLQQVGQDQTDDRGIYRIFQLEPGTYIVSAVPRNSPVSDLRQLLAAGPVSLGVEGRVVSFGDNVTFTVGDNGAAFTPALAASLEQLQEQASMAYAPVYFPGTTTAAEAQTVALGAGEERGGVDFRLRLVPTTRVTGIVSGPAGALPPATQVALVPRHGGMDVPNIGQHMTRVGPDGRFTLSSVTPGDYALQARATIRSADGAAPRGGRGGPGQVAQILWASTDISVGAQPLPDFVLNLQAGMTVSGRVEFAGAGASSVDPSAVRITLSPRGSQLFELGGAPPAQVDASGRFTVTGVAPGRYTLAAGMRGGGPPFGGRGLQGGGGGSGNWMLRSVMAAGRDVLDFPIDIGPNQSLSDVVVTFTTETQQLSGTIQDTQGRATSDFTIVVFPPDKRYWMPQARRIAATRPGTDGRFSFRGLPPGDYRLTAVTDVEPGEWFDPAFLDQLGGASIPITLSEGEQKVQDIRLAGG